MGKRRFVVRPLQYEKRLPYSQRGRYAAARKSKTTTLRSSDGHQAEQSAL